jgi:hypothetical protein
MEITLTQEQLEAILEALARPFDLADIKWVVKSTTQDQKKALVAPYADPRAYHKRLNGVLSASGWGNEYKTEIVAGLTRMVKGKQIATGKVSTVCSLSVFAIGTTKSSTGEQWADDDNAVTRAEAQSFKRAAAMFGLGAYLYAIKNGEDGVNLWVPYDGQKRQITQTPRLPDWALNESDLAARHNKPPQQRPAPAQVKPPAPVKSQQQPSGAQPNQQQRSPATAAEARKKEHVAILGLPLYASIVSEVERRSISGELKGEKFGFLENMLALKAKQLADVQAAAAEMPLDAMEGLLDRHGVRRLDLIPNFGILKSLADDLDVGLQKAA